MISPAVYQHLSTTSIMLVWCWLLLGGNWLFSSLNHTSDVIACIVFVLYTIIIINFRVQNELDFFTILIYTRACHFTHHRLAISSQRRKCIILTQTLAVYVDIWPIKSAGIATLSAFGHE